MKQGRPSALHERLCFCSPTGHADGVSDPCPWRLETETFGRAACMSRSPQRPHHQGPLSSRSLSSSARGVNGRVRLAGPSDASEAKQSNGSCAKWKRSTTAVVVVGSAERARATRSDQRRKKKLFWWRCCWVCWVVCRAAAGRQHRQASIEGRWLLAAVAGLFPVWDSSMAPWVDKPGSQSARSRGCARPTTALPKGDDKPGGQYRNAKNSPGCVPLGCFFAPQPNGHSHQTRAWPTKRPSPLPLCCNLARPPSSTCCLLSAIIGFGVAVTAAQPAQSQHHHRPKRGTAPRAIGITLLSSSSSSNSSSR